MKIKDILTEAPLPADWNTDVFTPKTSYAEKIRYAVDRAQKMGKGSSRTVFEIMHEGRPTILKVAHNKKGLAQNEAEANILNDNYLKTLDIAIPLIDYDTEHAQPIWVHVEKAVRASEKQLCTIMQCVKLEWLVFTAVNAYTGKSIDYTRDVMTRLGLTSRDEAETFFTYVDKMQELISLGVDITDFTVARNWGLYQGEPVVIDLGFNESVKQQHYSGGWY